MNAKIQVLKADISADKSQIYEIFEILSTYSTPFSDPEKAIVVGYHLHNLYTAFEHLGGLVAAAFENHIDNRAQWHALLLRRMAQDIEGIRPKLFSEETYRCLDELRGFRHVFRSAYSVTLNPERMEYVFNRAMEMQSLFPGDLKKFTDFLNSLNG